MWPSTTGLEDLKEQFSMKIHTFATCHRIYIVWTVVESRIDVYTLCVRNWRGSPLHWNLHCHFLKIKIQALDWRSVLLRNQTGEKKWAPINSVEGKYAFWKNLRNRLHFAKPMPLAAHNGGALWKCIFEDVLYTKWYILKLLFNIAVTWNHELSEYWQSRWLVLVKVLIFWDIWHDIGTRLSSCKRIRQLWPFPRRSRDWHAKLNAVNLFWADMGQSVTHLVFILSTHASKDDFSLSDLLTCRHKVWLHISCKFEM